MLDAGLLEEVAASPRGSASTAAQAVGYKELLPVVRGECSLESATGRAIDATTSLARRQRTFFRRDPRIRWLEWDDDGGAGGHRPGRVRGGGMDFVKMEGLGNDFVVLRRPLDSDRRQSPPGAIGAAGIGADGVLVVSPRGDRGTHGVLERRRVACGDVRQRPALRGAVRRGSAVWWRADEFVVDHCGRGAPGAGGRGLGASRWERFGPNPVRSTSPDTPGIGVVGNPHAVAFVDDCYAVPIAAVGLWSRAIRLSRSAPTSASPR